MIFPKYVNEIFLRLLHHVLVNIIPPPDDKGNDVSSISHFYS